MGNPPIYKNGISYTEALGIIRTHPRHKMQPMSRHVRVDWLYNADPAENKLGLLRHYRPSGITFVDKSIHHKQVSRFITKHQNCRYMVEPLTEIMTATQMVERAKVAQFEYYCTWEAFSDLQQIPSVILSYCAKENMFAMHKDTSVEIQTLIDCNKPGLYSELWVSIPIGMKFN